MCRLLGAHGEAAARGVPGEPRGAPAALPEDAGPGPPPRSASPARFRPWRPAAALRPRRRRPLPGRWAGPGAPRPASRPSGAAAAGARCRELGAEGGPEMGILSITDQVPSPRPPYRPAAPRRARPRRHASPGMRGLVRAAAAGPGRRPRPRPPGPSPSAERSPGPPRRGPGPAWARPAPRSAPPAAAGTRAR